MFSKIELLPDHLKQQVMDYIEFLLSRETEGGQPDQTLQPQQGKKALKAGFLKGSFVMADDFDEPLEDFKEYMQRSFC